MAFLDNSGDIILAATLTELGRQRMAKGTAKCLQKRKGNGRKGRHKG